MYRFAAVASDVPERSICRVAPALPDDGAAWPDNWPRPSRLLPLPEQIETLVPERVFRKWWKRDAELATVRDYFRVENDGASASGSTARAISTYFKARQLGRCLSVALSRIRHFKPVTTFVARTGLGHNVISIVLLSPRHRFSSSAKSMKPGYHLSVIWIIEVMVWTLAA